MGALLDLFGGAVISLPLTAVFLLLTDRCRFRKKWIWVILFTLYMNAMLTIVGIPDFWYIRWEPIVNWIPFTDFSHSNVLGMVLNIVLFVPFGGFLVLYFKEFQSWQSALTAGFLMSLVVEIMQLVTLRVTDVDDVLMNTLGTMIGSGITKAVFRKSPAEESAADGIKLAAMIWLILLTMGFARYPLMECLYAHLT